jgi:pimeloyl-ACP methyl ester carboxylesterase
MTANAKTYLDEQRDPDWAVVDLDAPATLSVPVLLTNGDQSPPFFSDIVARLAEAMEDAQVMTLTGAGHVPHLTHPTEWIAVVRDFAGSSD